MAIFDGGPDDPAYQNAKADIQAITQVPVLFANDKRGHAGYQWDDNGGEAAKAGVAWFNWQLLDDMGPTGKGMFVGPDCGQVIVTLDDQPPKTVARFDSYCTYPRLATLLLGSELPDTVHTVKIEIHPDQPDKAKILATRNNKIDKPERFDGMNFYPGAILLVGEMEK